jgi:hypothetical protein
MRPATSILIHFAFVGEAGVTDNFDELVSDRPEGRSGRNNRAWR